MSSALPSRGMHQDCCAERLPHGLTERVDGNNSSKRLSRKGYNAKEGGEVSRAGLVEDCTGDIH